MRDFSKYSSLLAGEKAQSLGGLYAQYLQNPSSVDSNWGEIFEHLDDDARALLEEIHGTKVNSSSDFYADSLKQHVSMPEDHSKATLDAIRASMLIRSFRVRGHLHANLDPLGIEKSEYHGDLDPRTYGFEEKDFNHPIYLDGNLGLESATLKDIHQILCKTYAGNIGIEFMHIQDPDQRSWVQENIENINQRYCFTPHEKKKIYHDLVRAEVFERFLHTKYPSAKRFGLEGAESVIPALEQCLLQAGSQEIKEVILGMAHRGRLNVLANILEKPFSAIFSEFQGGNVSPEDVQGSGDVKYHLGCSNEREFSGEKIHLSLTANPSHLEAVDPVVIGKVRAKQAQYKDAARNQVMGILLHGDAAFAGQGLVAETLSLSELPGYRVGGTLHLVINNQIGFTTSPQHSRSSPYCSDVAKMIQAPVFHVNGDDPEAVSYVLQLAMKFRRQFKKDVVVDLFCYRRHGHNEIDEPSFTQPFMYQTIKNHPTTRQIYLAKLIQEKILTSEDAQEIETNYEEQLNRGFKEASSYNADKVDWLDGRWTGFDVGTEKNTDGDTVVPLSQLKTIAESLTHVPEGFSIHPRLERILKEKKKRLESGEGIDWATGEALAFGSLLSEGHFVRVSGQDCGRGTFSQRHAVFVDQKTEAKYIPLNGIQENQAELEILDSPLSEASVLGFEYGYTVADPNGLVIWEAQFGDFANGAQVIIDQFLCSGEAKWLRMSGLVMLLPHGYEGQGPEHSSARLERYLQLSAERNWQVVNCSTPANYFHVLRRQLRRNIRKPLVVMTPKQLLRHKMAVSNLQDFGPGNQFQRVIPEEDKDIRHCQRIKRVILCSGKIYYDLVAQRQAFNLLDIAIVRLEQLYPFPKEELLDILSPYHESADIVWCQEEPENMGAWHFIDRRLENVLLKANYGKSRPIYMGRPSMAATATGYLKIHEEKQQQLVNRALMIE